MEFDPPIATRTTDELIAIANYPDEWNKHAVEQAKTELLKRGISREQQDNIIAVWEEEFRTAQADELADRASERFSWFDLFFMTLKFPKTILSDWDLKKEGYFLKFKQRLYAIGAGIILWTLVAIWGIAEYNRSQLAWQNKVNNMDIYEWEKSNYTDAEIAEFRKRSIEQVIETVRENETNGTPTYVIIKQDTIPNSEVEQLRNLDMSNIRDVVFEGDFEPEPHEWITIKLVENADNKR